MTDFVDDGDEDDEDDRSGWSVGGHPDGFRGRQGVPYGVGGGVRNQDGPNRGMLMGGPARNFSSSSTSSNVSLPLPMPENALRRSGQSSAPTTPSIILKESPRLQPVVLPHHTRQTIQSTYIDNDDDLDRLAMIDERGRGRGSDLGRVSVATSALTDDRDPFSYAVSLPGASDSRLSQSISGKGS